MQEFLIFDKHSKTSFNNEELPTSWIILCETEMFIWKL